MTQLIAGLVLFLGIHSLRIFADDFRTRMISKMGVGPWKGAFSVIALIGFVLIIRGYAEARMMPEFIWVSPVWTRHLAALVTLPAFILLVAAYVPGNALKAKLGHPMLAGVKAWALAHLLANGTQADVILFGSFLVWAIADFAVSRRRDRKQGVVAPAIRKGATVQVVIVGVVAWAVFAGFLHQLLIGVSPF